MMMRKILPAVLFLLANTLFLLDPLSAGAAKQSALESKGLADDFAYDLMGGKPVNQKLYFAPTDKQVTWWCRFRPFTIWASPNMTAKWYMPNGELFNEVKFSQPYGGGLFAKTSLPVRGDFPARAPGKWRVEIYWDAEKVDEQSFTIGEPQLGAADRPADLPVAPAQASLPTSTPLSDADVQKARANTYTIGDPDIPVDIELKKARRDEALRKAPTDGAGKEPLSDADVTADYWGPVTPIMLARTDEYIGLLRARLANDASDYRIYAMMAKIYLVAKDPNRANRAIKRAIFLHGDSGYLHNFQGIIYISRKMNEEALTAFLRAIDANKDYYPAYFNVGSHLLQRGDYVNAKRYLETAALHDVETETARTKIAFCDAVIKKVTDTVETAKKRKEEEVQAAKATPRQPYGPKFAPYLEMIEKKEYGPCIKELRAMIGRGEEVIAAHDLLATIYRGQGLYRQEADEYEEIVKINPADANAYARLAEAYYNLKEYAKSRQTYERALLIDPANAHIFLFLGKDCLELGDDDMARRAAREAARLDNSLDEAYDIRGEAAGRLGNEAEALAAFNELLKLRPTDGMVYLKIARIYAKAGDITKAQEYMEKGIACNPADTKVIDEAARLKVFMKGTQ